MVYKIYNLYGILRGEKNLFVFCSFLLFVLNELYNRFVFENIKYNNKKDSIFE